MTKDEVLAKQYLQDLAVLARMPFDAEVITPQEILRLVQLCRVYDVDWSPGLEARQGRVFAFTRETPRGREVVSKRVRVRRERLLEDPGVVWVPDGDLVWAAHVIGEVKRNVLERLRLDVRGA